eukprot:221564_1
MMKKKKQRLWIQNRRESEYHFGIASTNALSDGAEKLLYFYHFFYCYVWYCCFITFSDQLDGDLRQTSVNVVPFPRLHFFLCDPFPVHLIQTLDESRDDAKPLPPHRRIIMNNWIMLATCRHYHYQHCKLNRSLCKDYTDCHGIKGQGDGCHTSKYLIAVKECIASTQTMASTITQTQSFHGMMASDNTIMEHL